MKIGPTTQGLKKRHRANPAGRVFLLENYAEKLVKVRVRKVERF